MIAAKERKKFLRWTMMFAAAITGACAELDKTYSGGEAKGPCPLPKGFEKDVHSMLAFGVFLTFFGVLCDEEGRQSLKQAAKIVGHKPLPDAPIIRKALEEILDTVGIKDERHRWN